MQIAVRLDAEYRLQQEFRRDWRHVARGLHQSLLFVFVIFTVFLQL